MTADDRRPRVETLRRDHAVDAFTCGQPELDRFLIRYAFPAQQAGSSLTYVALIDETVVGFYTLVVGEVAHADAPERLTKGLARHPVPLMVLARLAVDRTWQGRGVGKGLLRNAMERTLHAAEIAGIRALAVHAKNDAAVSFYSHFGFVRSPTDPLHLFVLLKDVRRMLRG
jgi:GNAT superfamily N-acetyltransferase